MRPTRPLTAIVLSACAGMLAAQTPFVNTLMPQPAEVRALPSAAMPIKPTLSISISPQNSAPLHDAAERLMHELSNTTGVTFASRSTGAGDITLSVADAGDALPKLYVDESYTLDIDASHIAITAKTVTGAYRSMATLAQLAQPSATGWSFPAVHITDSPRFPWRGLMLDPGRHFLPVEVILRTLDGMASVKLNVFHFHLSEDQGFRIESKRFPKLHELGSEGQFYTQDDIRRIVAYAAARGIRVVPEFDLPGHSTSWFVGYPELASKPGPYHVEHTFGIFDAAFDPTRESTYQFLDEFFGEMATLFPDEYVHFGGDESNGKDWRSNPKISAYMKEHGYANTQALQNYFSKRLQEILRKHGKKVAGWDEILHPDLPSDVVVQVWHKSDFVVNSAKQGHLAFYSHPWYLDHNYSAAEMYAADPIPSNSGLSEAERKLILGGEACMWGEHVTAETVESRIWPRAAAVAERLWSPQATRDTKDMYRRLRVEELRLDALGIQHLTGADRRLRHITMDAAPPQALTAFIDTLEMPDFPQRSRLLRPTTETPMTNLVDALRPDPPLKSQFADLVDTYLDSTSPAERKAAGQRLESLFQSWVTLSPRLDEYAASRPVLHATATRRAQWPLLGKLGLELIAAKNNNTKLSSSQAVAADSLLKEAGTPIVELANFVVIDPMKKLFAATR